MTPDDPTPHPDFEVFSDASYYDMWCLRPIGNKSFNETLHFALKKDAVFASHVVASWMDKSETSYETG